MSAVQRGRPGRPARTAPARSVTPTAAARAPPRDPSSRPRPTRSRAPCRQRRVRVPRRATAGAATSTPLVVVVRTDEEAHRLADDLARVDAVGPGAPSCPSAARCRWSGRIPERDESAARLGCSTCLAEAAAGPGGRGHRWPPCGSGPSRTDRLGATRWRLRVGEPCSSSATSLHRAGGHGGYDPTPEVSGIGEIREPRRDHRHVAARRGRAARIELFGDEVDADARLRPDYPGQPGEAQRACLAPARRRVAVPAPTTWP